MLRFYLLGQLRVMNGDQPIDGLALRKVRQLLAYLLLFRDRWHHRDQLAALVWHDCDAERARKYIRQALWQIQSTLNCTDVPPLVVSSGDYIAINPDVDYWLDVQVLEEAATQVMPGDQLAAEAAQLLITAVNLYGSSLLEGVYENWCLEERERLEAHYLSILSKLVLWCETQGSYERGIGYGEMILRWDRTHEHTHCWLMRLHYFNGDRTAALRQYERCCAILSHELGVAPDEATRALYQHIKNDSLENSVSAGLTRRLVDLRRGLAELHTELTPYLHNAGGRTTHAHT